MLTSAAIRDILVLPGVDSGCGEKNMIDLKQLYGTSGGTLEEFAAQCPFDRGGEQWTRPAVVVVPGGGYAFVSKREAAPVAYNFLAEGFHVFVLTYSVSGEGAYYPEQLLQLACAIDYLKKNADKYRLDPDEIFVVGFSAGGHLVADLAVEHADNESIKMLALDCRPTAVGLGYPVITDKLKDSATFDNLLKGIPEKESAELRKRLRLDERVNADTPPAFIFTTAPDTAVPAQNSLRFALALADRGIPYELHVFPSGEHGGSTYDLEINSDAECRANGRWLHDCAVFFRRFSKYKF